MPSDDLDPIRLVAAERGTSVQSYLRDTVHAHAVYLRRQAGLARISTRLRGLPAVSDGDREAVLAAIDQANEERAEQLSDRPHS